MSIKSEKPRIDSIQVAIVLSGLIAGGLFFYANDNHSKNTEEMPIFELKATEANEQNTCKVVYLTEDKKCAENCQQTNWNIWSHKLFKTVMDDAYPNISCDVTMGSTYDFEFDIDNKRQVANVSVTHRFGDDDSTQLLTEKITNNLFTLKKSIEKLSNNSILTYPKNEKRTNTRILGAIQIVDNTIFVHVIETTIP